MTDKQRKKDPPTPPNLGRHEFGCRVCAHPKREEIERSFISWKSPAKIAAEFHIRDRSSVYRHAHALDLFPKRARNLRSALERLIERVDEVPVNAGAIVQAITAYAKINAQGQFVERNERVDMNDLFDKMNIEELEEYAANGTLPSWFPLNVGATPDRGPEGGDDE